MVSRKIIVVAPVRNEAWIIESFLEAATEWADHVILGDHFSTDGTVDLAGKYSDVDVIHASSNEFSEVERRNQLLTAARKYGKNNLVIALDADEILTPNIDRNFIEQNMLSQPVGTRFAFDHVNVAPGLNKFWKVPMDPVAFIDDGALSDRDLKIHFPRIPEARPGTPIIRFQDGGMLHLQYINWQRMESKHLWYKVWERINFPYKSQLEIYRRYSHMYHVANWRFKELPADWSLHLAACGVRGSAEASSEKFWWDSEVKKLLEQNIDLDFSLVLFNRNNGWEMPATSRQRAFARYIRTTGWLADLGWLFPARAVLLGLDLIMRRKFK